MEIFLQQLVNGFILGSMYALVALGYTMVYGIVNLINFAHGEVLMIGAMVAMTSLLWMQSAAPGMLGGWMLLIAFILAASTCVLVNLCIERLAYRPLRRAPKLAPLITAIGISLLLQTFAIIIWNPNPKPWPEVVSTAPIKFFGAIITQVQLLILVLTFISLIVLTWLVKMTRLGRAMRATAENQRVAMLMGVNPDRVIATTFAIGAVLAALAGMMWAANYAVLQHDMGFNPGLKAFTAAVFGGIGNLAGAVLGGFLLGIIESLGSGYIGDWTGGVLGSHYSDIFAFMILIITLSFKPSGLLGARVSDRA